MHCTYNRVYCYLKLMEGCIIYLPLGKDIIPANICAEFCALISSVTREDNHKPV